MLSLDDRLPKNLRPDVKDLQQQFKKNSCPVHWKQTGPVKHAARKRKKGRLPGWEVGKGKKAVFVGHKDKRCKISEMHRHTPFVYVQYAGLIGPYSVKTNIPSKYSKPVRQAQNTVGLGILTMYAGTIAGAGLLMYGSKSNAPENGELFTQAGYATLGSVIPAGVLIIRSGERSARRSAAEAVLKGRKAKGLKKRKTAKPLVARCFDEKLKRQGRVSADTLQAAQRACEQLGSILKPGKWEYGKLNGVSPAELAVRAANQNRALNRGVQVRTTKDLTGLENEMFAALKRHDLKRASDLAAKLNKKASSIAASRRGKPSGSNCNLLKSESAKFFESDNYGGLDTTDYERLKPLISYIGRKEVCGGNAVAYTKKEVDGIDQIVRAAERVKREIADEKRERLLARYYSCQSWDNTRFSLTLGRDGTFMSKSYNSWASGSWYVSGGSVALLFERADISSQNAIGEDVYYQIHGSSLVVDGRHGSTVCR